MQIKSKLFLLSRSPLYIFRAALILTPPMVTETYEFNPIRGQYVNIYLPGMAKVLTLCEVEVYTGKK